MSTAVESTRPADASFETEVDRQLAQATGRIRMHDAILGTLILGSLVAAYAFTIIILDKLYVLPDLARQASLLAFGAIFATVAYFVLVRPLARRLNPLYAAMKVERTIENAKNSVAGYVELKERELNPHVRTALSARAAEAVSEADLNHAVSHRSLLYLGSVFAAMMLALVVLLVLYRPAQFFSLLGRTFNPFQAGAIASRTQVQVLIPEGGNATVTEGQPVAIAAQVNGRVPEEASPERVRALIRYSATDAAYEELPLERGSHKHEWSVQVPSHLVQNGFWYKVAAGDSETPEYRITVRGLPRFLGFQMSYDYPAYLRMKPDVVPETNDPTLSGFRGTRVVLTARTNREVLSGRMMISLPGPQMLELVGERVPGQPNSLRFPLTLTDSGNFRLAFTAAGERVTEAGPYGIQVFSDQPPTIEITEPKDDAATLPANAKLAVDATIADDFGLAVATLRMQVKGPKPVPLAARPFQEGKSLRRVEDGTFPDKLEYKDSVEIAKLTTEAGAAAKLREGTVIEYWIEATDNQEPKPNVGRSRTRTVTLGPPLEEKIAKEQNQRREQQEQANRKAEQKRLDGEKRPPKAGPHPRAENKPEGGEAEPMDGADPKPMGEPQAGEAQPKDAAQPKPNAQDPMGEKPPQARKKDGTAGEPGGDPQAGAGEPGDEQTRKEAERVQKEIDKEKTTGGEAKPSDTTEPGQRAEAAGQKPMPMAKDQPPSESKEAGSQEQGGSKEPSGKDGGESKPEGKVQPPPPPATEKPDPKAGDKPNSEKNENGAESKPEPLGGSPGQDKETPEAPRPMPGEASKTEEAKKNEAGEGKSPSGKPGEKSEEKQQPGSPKDKGGEPGTKNGEPQEGPPSDASAKPKPDDQPSRGGDKPSQESKTAEPGQKGAGEPRSDAGSGKGETAPEPASRKSAPPKAGEEATEPKTPSEGDNADPEQKTDPENPGTGGKPSAGKPQDNRGSSKPSDPGELAREMGRKSQQDKNAQGKENPKDGPEQLLRDKDKFKQTAKDLNSKDENTRKDAEDRMDQAVGKEGREEARESARKLDSGNQQEQKKAEEDLDQLQKKKKKEAEARNDPSEQQNRKDELAKKAKDLNSPNKETREKAEKDLDQQVGQENRKQLQESMKEAAGGDAGKKEAAEKKLDELARKPDSGEKGAQQKPKSGEKGDTLEKNAQKKPGTGEKGAGEKNAGGGEPTPEQIAEMKKTMEDLASSDDKKREAAEKKLDQQVGKENREKLQDALNDAKANPEEAKRKLEELAKEVANKQAQKDGKAGEDQKKGLSPDEQKSLEEKLADLNSSDAQKRKEAEKAFDEKLGKDQREKLQEAMKKNDPKNPGKPGSEQEQLADAKKKLDEMAKNGRGDRDPRGNEVPRGASNPEEKENSAAEADPKNRLKSAELQLEEFKKKQFDRDFLKSIGKNEEEYRRFLEGVERMVQRIRDEAEQPDKPATAPMPSQPTINVGGAGGVEARYGSEGGAGSTGGPAYAPPGFKDAKEKFSREALKLKQPAK